MLPVYGYLCQKGESGVGEVEPVEVYKSGMGFLLNIFRELYSHRFVNSLFVMATVYFMSSHSATFSLVTRYATPFYTIWLGAC